MEEDAVEPQAEPIEEIVEQAMPEQEAPEEHEPVEKPDKTMIPLSVAQKLREKKKELELELQWEKQERQRLLQERQSAAQKPPEEDNSRFESATREDLSKSQEEIVRIVEEKRWIKENPEKYEKVNEYLPKFLKQRPNLASAIDQATNRYEEAYTLMEALTPKQQKELKAAVSQKKEAPNSPNSIPKAAALNEAVDLMNMSDSEFAAWRATKKKRR
jgi:hypothetical protein